MPQKYAYRKVKEEVGEKDGCLKREAEDGYLGLGVTDIAIQDAFKISSEKHFHGCGGSLGDDFDGLSVLV